MIIPFQKYHGLGNDFILLDEKTWADLPERKRTDLIVSICDRHTGVGADGLIVVQSNPLEMVYYNQDGSRADMCGNGLRCFSRYVIDNEIRRERNFDVDTLAGTRQVSIPDFDHISLDLGQADFHPGKLAVQDNQNLWKQSLPDEELKDIVLYPLYMNTIHTVVFVDDNLPWDEKNFAKLGEAICHHPAFTKGTNVNFVRVLDDHSIEMRTYERGCGMTLACGTGAAAAAVAANKVKNLQSPIRVVLERGDLDIMLDGDRVSLCGPARRIAKGEYEYE